ncbi:MAG: L-threonylcarbamoyladenylate synthase, partial [Bifidobacteriaceae bacterium]|nr:L-threonylcarbamoyladenylate synthase [Bifidobacteriaceae bacterium]
FAAKGRPPHLALPVLLPDAVQAAALSSRLSPAARALMSEFWPGPVTIVVQANPNIELHLGAPSAARQGGRGHTIGLRQPAHPVTLALLRQTGPLAVTSANLSGQAPALTAAEALAQLGDAVAVALDAGPAPGRQPSTVIDLSWGQAKVLRAGAVAEDRLRRALAAAGAGAASRAGTEADGIGQPRSAADSAGGLASEADGAGQPRSAADSASGAGTEADGIGQLEGGRQRAGGAGIAPEPPAACRPGTPERPAR